MSNYEQKGNTALSVLIPTHGRPALLGRTLASLAECIIPEGYVETVVVESGPKSGAEGTVAAASSKWPHLKLRYLHVSRANKSHALNEALKTIADGLVVFFDDDVRMEPGVLEAYAEAATVHPESAFFGGSFGCDYEERPPDWLLPLLPFSARGVQLPTSERPPEYLGFNWAAYVSDIKAAGGFNPGFGPGSPTSAAGQESNMQRRLREAGGLEVDVPKAFVWHFVPLSRCSPRWAVKRAFRTGLTYGGRAKVGRVAGWPRRQVVQALRSSAGVVRHSLERDEEAKWRSHFALFQAMGQLVGYIILSSTAERTS